MDTEDKNQKTYIDGFVFPISEPHFSHYEKVAAEVAAIWKEHGALAYVECLGDELMLEGTRSFTEALEVKEDECIVFGWLIFPSKEIRDLAHQKVSEDPRMTKIVAPLSGIFDAQRMVFGGFEPFVQ